MGLFSPFKIKRGVLLKYRGKELDVTVPQGVVHIDRNAFRKRPLVRRVLLPSTLVSLAAGTFLSCKEMPEIVVHGANGYLIMEDGVLYTRDKKNVLLCLNAKTLTECVIPDGVVSIESYAFKGCSALTSLVLPVGIRRIGEDAFKGCVALKKLTLPQKLLESAGTLFVDAGADVTIRVIAEAAPPAPPAAPPDFGYTGVKR